MSLGTHYIANHWPGSFLRGIACNFDLKSRGESVQLLALSGGKSAVNRSKIPKQLRLGWAHGSFALTSRDPEAIFTPLFEAVTNGESTTFPSCERIARTVEGGRPASA